MATLSLTPRETSSGLRKPRAAAPAVGGSPRGAQPPKVGFLPEARGASGGGSSRRRPSSRSHAHDEDETPVPSRDELRNGARVLHERKLQKLAALLQGDQIVDVSAAIRERTKLTLKMAFAKPDTGADLNLAREMELRRQLARIEEMRKTYDVLHAEAVSKEVLKRELELNYATDHLGVATDHEEVIAARRALQHGHHVPAPPPGKPPATGSRRSTPRGAGVSGTSSAPLDGGSSAVGPPASMSYDGSELPQRSLVEIMWEGATPRALEEMKVLVDQANEALAQMQHDCQAYAYVEHRTFEANFKLGGLIDAQRSTMGELAKEEERLLEMQEEANQAMKVALRALAEAKVAHADQQRNYEDIKWQRAQVGADKKKQKEREKLFEAKQKDSLLDAQGELDEEAEEALRKEASEIQQHVVMATLEKEAATAEERRMAVIFQRLRRATHDPESIATPTDLMISMLSASERGEALQAQISDGQELQSLLLDEHHRLKGELQKHMYGITSSTMATVEVEREMAPAIYASESLMATSQFKCGEARKLVLECKQGLGLLVNLALGESATKIVPDAEVGAALERVEKHVVACLSVITAPPPQPFRRGGRAQTVAERAAEKAEELERAAEAEEQLAYEEAAESAAAEAEAAARAADAAQGKVEAAKANAMRIASQSNGGEDPGSPGSPGSPTQEEVASLDAVMKAEKAARLAREKAAAAEEKAAKAKAAAKQTSAERKADRAKTAKGGASASGSLQPGSPHGSANGSASDGRAAAADPKQLAEATSLMPSNPNNVRVVTEEEMEESVEQADYEDDEGVDADGSELLLTRRHRRSSGQVHEPGERRRTKRVNKTGAQGAGKPPRKIGSVSLKPPPKLS